MDTLKRIIRVLHTITVWISMIFMALLVLIISIHVMLRYVFNSGFSWSEEVSTQVLIPAFVFLGMAIGVEERLHININVIPKNVFKRLDFILLKLADLCKIIVGIIMIFFGIILIGFTSLSILPATGWPACLQYIVMPLSGALIILFSVAYIFSLKIENKGIDRYLKDVDREIK
jgi:TRAP-type C4-dicarboxylate transport system permease small subunit